MVRPGAGLVVQSSDAGGRTWRSLVGNPAGAPALVAGVVVVLYGLWLVLFFQSSHDVRDLIDIGRKFAQQSTTIPLIRLDPHVHYDPTNLGQDGQFSYYLALDPSNARYYMDYPAYRYGRALYPMVARMLALGQPGLIPYTMILINWLAVGAGTFFVAAWLRRRQYSPWVALVYGLGAGVFVAFRYDLTEPLCYALVALAVYLFDSERPARVLLAGISFALAALARETALVFAVPYGLAVLFEPGTTGPWRARLGANFRRASLLLVVALTPIALYRVFLRIWLGSYGDPAGNSLVLVPFQGLFTYWPWHKEQITTIVMVVVPAMVCAGVALWAVWKRLWRVEVWVLLAHVQLFVVMLNPFTYGYFFDVQRITIGVVLAAIYCLPVFDHLLRQNRMWFCACATLWLVPTAYWLVITW